MSDQDYRLIPLRARDGKIRARAIVDPQDYERFGHMRWSLVGEGYVGHGSGLRLHRAIMEVTDPKIQVDHKDLNPLHNRRANLRVVTNAENSQNRGRNRRNTSGFRGVTWAAKEQKWLAQVKLNGRNHYCGYHEDVLDAARAAEAFRREHMPFAIPDPTLDPVK